MKRILVVDESLAVRETLALILGREFVVVQRPPPPAEIWTDADEGVDLLILGLSPGWTDSRTLLRSAASARFAVLFLVDSRSILQYREQQHGGRIDYLAKPFNPYELRDKVGRLLSPQESLPPPIKLFAPRTRRPLRYLEFPYVSRTAAALAQRYSDIKLPVLIYGEMGCGQESVARDIYELSSPTGPWIALSCPALKDRNVLDGIRDMVASRIETGQPLTVFLDHVESLDVAAQASVLRLLEEEEHTGGMLWILSTARGDLLESVYRGEFLEALYYRLAASSLHLAPLRERRDDIPVLAAHVAEQYGKRVGLGKITFSPEATARLCNYLWFGNIREMETVMARSVAAHRKEVLEADDLLFSVEGDLNLSLSVAETRVGAPAGLVRAEEGEAEGLAKSPSTNGSALDLASVVTELAHELKNPMVTIKTFSQLLGERYDDPVFRTRFRELVSGDIERMDELLETLLEFSRLGRPAGQPISLLEQLRHVLEDVLPESKKAWVQDELIHIGPDTEVFMDQRHLRYALKNIVRTALFESKPRGEVDIHSEGEGVIVISYPQEGGRVVALSPYLDPNARTTEGDDPGMSLRLILARTLLEKNGGKIKMKYDDADVVRVRIELPLAQATVRNA